MNTNKTTARVWQQIHLNFYTQYSYNKWHNVQKVCPLCQKIPESIYHLILYCDLTVQLWEELQPTLMKLHPVLVSDEAKAFGIEQKKQTNGILLRNWLTYLLRDNIAEAEKAAYYAPTRVTLEKFKQHFNEDLKFEIQIKAFQYKNENKLDIFDKIITHAEVLCQKRDNGEYRIPPVFS